MPTVGQLVLVVCSAAMYAAAAAFAVRRLYVRRDQRTWLGRMLTLAALACAVAALLWHCLADVGWKLGSDNFAALMWLAVLLGAFVAYVQWMRRITGLDAFALPVVVMLLAAAAVFGRSEPHRYRTLAADAVVYAHWVTAYGGAAVLAIAALAGAMYITASRRLRRKLADPPLASLERLERLLMTSATIGFALLTAGLVSGIIRMIDHGIRLSSAKLLPAVCAWLVYAVVMHAPMNPRFRGRRAAILSVVGFALVICTLVAVQFVPGGIR